MKPLRDPYGARIPRSKGTYALLLWLERTRLIQVGKLGVFQFPAGYYLYAGSALGPGGLAGRLGRHIAPAHPASSYHWHIDYLRCYASIVAVWLCEHKTRREHDWATHAGQLAGATCPVPRFGASDCRCPAHLFHFDQLPVVGHFSSSLRQAFPGDGPLQTIQAGEETRVALLHPPLPG